MRSLRARLFWVWALSLLASLAVGILLVRLEGRSTGAQVAREADALAEACEMIGDAYGYYTNGWAGPAPPDTDAAYRRDLAGVVSVALGSLQGVRGGIWHVGEGPLAGEPPDGTLLATLAAGVAEDERPASRQTDRTGGLDIEPRGLGIFRPGIVARARGPDGPDARHLRLADLAGLGMVAPCARHRDGAVEPRGGGRPGGIAAASADRRAGT
jgi:hypothetical protein